MAPVMNDDLRAFAQYLETYAPVFGAIQSQIMAKYEFDFVYDDGDHIFELEKTTVRCGNETREVDFMAFGCIIDRKFYWANHMNRYWMQSVGGQSVGGQSVGGQSVGGHLWKTSLAPLFETACPPPGCSPHTIPYLVSLVHSPECNVVAFRSRDDVQIFAIVEIALDDDPYVGASFCAAPLLITNAATDIATNFRSN